MKRLLPALPWIAAATCVAALLLAPPRWQPAAGFVLPGTLLAVFAIARWARRDDAAGWPLRIGLLLAAFSALAFAAQGVWLPDPVRPDATATRLHALAWSLWWVAFVPAAVLLAAGGLRPRWLHAAAGLAVPLAALALPGVLGPAMASTLALAAWLAWWLLLSRAATSAPGSPRPGRR